MSKIEYSELAPGFRISRVLTGMWQVADLEKDGNTLDPIAAAKHMIPYVEAGFTTFDMADHYGSAEVIAGHFKNAEAAGRHAQMLTKWVPKPGPVTREEVREGVERALQRLETERLDLLQYHAWNYADPNWLDSLFWLRDLRDEGLIAHLGVTNFDAAHVRVAVASGIPIITNQVSFSLLDQRAAGAMTEVCKKYRVRLLAYGTLAGGFLSEQWLGQPEPTELSTWSQMKYKRFIDAAGGWDRFQSLLRVVASVAARHDVTIAAVASRHVLDQPAVCGVILGARLGQNDHINENRAIFKLKLEDRDRRELQEAISSLEPIPGGCGDEYRKPPFLTAAGDLSDHYDSIPPAFVPEKDDNGTQRVFSGTSWEDFAGYCRAIRHGNTIEVSGTTATQGSRIIGGIDPAAQTHFVIDKILGAIESLGGSLEDVVRTRVFIKNMNDWERVARAHGERFGHIKPANTLVEARLVGDEYLVEIEARAVISDRRD
ncbi:MAG: aldo/keto reductase [Xanthomonadales bacterium]|nr:aldo/keto reductase [Xanthomonadales bacterium]